MKTRYNSQDQNINTLTMNDCLQHNKPAVHPSFDYGFMKIQVHNYRQME